MTLDTTTLERLLVPLPDLPDRVHGIVSVDPPKVQCDGCGLVATERPGKLNLLILTCGILFNPSVFSRGDERRLCVECAAAAGWSS